MIKTCRVRLLTRAERDLVESAGMQSAIQEIATLNEQYEGKGLPRLTPLQQDVVAQRRLKRQCLIASVHSFGPVIDDRQKIQSYWSLLIYSDEERIEQEVDALIQTFRTKDKRGRHICSECGEQTRCPAATEGAVEKRIDNGGTGGDFSI